MKRIILFLFLCFAFLSLNASDDDALLKKANEHYQAGDYKSAVEEYEDLLKKDYQSADLHYNLGNAYFRMNDLGHAVLHFEKAALLQPRDKDIQHNLMVVRNKLPDQFDVIPDFFVTRWWAGLQKFTSPTGWGIIGLLILWAGIAGLILWLRGDNRKRRKQGFLIGIILLILSILPFALGFSALKKQRFSERAVIMTAQVTLKSAPDEVSETLLELHAGTSLSVLDEIGAWKKVRLSNGEEGWLEAKVLEEI